MARRTAVKTKRGTRDAEASRAAILQAALDEFSSVGYDGARVDRIAAEAGLSKPLLYDYFGDKDELYKAALREAYVQIRAGEEKLALEALSPEDAVAALVMFTMTHFRTRPWFITMLNTENLRQGSSVGKIGDRREIQSKLLIKLEEVLKRGWKDGVFLRKAEPVEVYLMIASLCYFPVSNRFTLAEVFGFDASEEGLNAHARRATEAVVGWLKQKGES
ncbi:TetR/AcrR family transcriptional regulator [Martelella mediterranea]|uniref:Nicotinate degradation protein S n=1 Tax=Martelella mediterranea DSM 17316 TaxID=1122214 RepID=A0A1U9Z4B5_9HYPH|nr:TetR/AcrR family transcriptional regulator [Martelella mediterranea]AQZ52470.1 Nicotinate degradation protein S [Martelella mediterranea DSM 17316]